MTTNDRKALFDQQTERVGIDIVKIESASINTLYLCRDAQSIVSNGNTYEPAAMEVVKPEKGSTNSNASLKISGVDQSNIELVQSLPADAEVYIEMAFVFTDAPNDYIDGPYNFIVEGISIDSATAAIKMELIVESPLAYIVSQTRYDNEGFPAIWT